MRGLTPPMINLSENEVCFTPTFFYITYEPVAKGVRERAICSNHCSVLGEFRGVGTFAANWLKTCSYSGRGVWGGGGCESCMPSPLALGPWGVFTLSPNFVN